MRVLGLPQLMKVFHSNKYLIAAKAMTMVDMQKNIGKEFLIESVGYLLVSWGYQISNVQAV